MNLRGAWNNREGGVVDFLVINANRKEFLYGGARSSGGPATGHYSIQAQTITESVWSSDYVKHLIPPGWADGAELLIIGDENGGSFSQSFDFPNIKLSNER